MTVAGTLDPIDARRILDVLTEQRQRIAGVDEGVLAARTRVAASAGAVVWSGPSRVEFAGRTAELIDELDHGLRCLAEALDACDRAMRLVEARTAQTDGSGGMTAPTGAAR